MSDPRNGAGPKATATPSAEPLDALAARAERASHSPNRLKPRGPAPTHLWNPPYCGDLDIRIKRDGTWHYLGEPIRREPLVRLFGSILTREPDGRHYLVTPVEKVGITVEDAPFIGLDIDAEGGSANRGDGEQAQRIVVLTNHDERVTIDADHPLSFRSDPETRAPAPYIVVRNGLEARLDRKSMFRLAELAVTEPGATGERLGVWSCGVFFALAEETR